MKKETAPISPAQLVGSRLGLPYGVPVEVKMHDAQKTLELNCPSLLEAAYIAAPRMIQFIAQNVRGLGLASKIIVTVNGSYYDSFDL